MAADFPSKWQVSLTLDFTKQRWHLARHWKRRSGCDRDTNQSVEPRWKSRDSNCTLYFLAKIILNTYITKLYHYSIKKRIHLRISLLNSRNRCHGAAANGRGVGYNLVCSGWSRETALTRSAGSVWSAVDPQNFHLPFPPCFRFFAFPPLLWESLRSIWSDSP